MDNPLIEQIDAQSAHEEVIFLMSTFRENLDQLKARCFQAAKHPDSTTARFILQGAKRRLQLMQEEAGECRALHLRRNEIHGRETAPEVVPQIQLYEKIAAAAVESTEQILNLQENH